MFVIAIHNLLSILDVYATIRCADDATTAEVVALTICHRSLTIRDLYGIGILVEVRAIEVPDGQMAVVGDWMAVLVERLEPSLPLFRPAGIELMTQLSTHHAVIICTESIDRHACIPIRVVVCVEHNGSAIIATEDVASIRTDVHAAHHETVRDETCRRSPAHEASAAIDRVAVYAASEDAIL